MYSLIDTHCHLDYLKQASSNELVKLAADNGVEKLITISVEPENLQSVVELSQNHEFVFGTQGVHPHEAKKFNDDVYATIKINASSNKKIVAIGEIGLDFHYNNSPKDIQIKVFKQQLELAIELSLPVVIHTRDAEDDTIQILEEYGPRMTQKGVLHSFTSEQRLADVALNNGFFLGFNGIITFKKAKNVRDVLENTPIDRILIETDAPFLTPVPHRGKENAPHYLPHIFEFVAEVKNLSCEILEKQLQLNTKTLFGI